jgi:hypothetical protein
MNYDDDYDDHAHARNTDPNTSHWAAAKVDVKSFRAVLLQLITASGDLGLTTDEATALTGKQKTSVSPAFAPMRRKGLIHLLHDEDGVQVFRKAPLSGDLQQVWVIGPEPAPAPGAAPQQNECVVDDDEQLERIWAA